MTAYKGEYGELIKHLEAAKEELCIAYGLDLDDSVMNGELVHIDKLIMKAKRHMEESE